MSVTTRHASHGRRRAGRARTLGALLGTAGLLAVASFLSGRALAPPARPADPIENAGGIPVGVVHSRAGALAAADSYVAVSYDSVERDRVRDSRLINADYAGGIRASAWIGAAAVRSQNAEAMRLWGRGGQNLSLIGARRLDYYRDDTAQVSSWNVNIFWGPGRPPKQAWVLTETSLHWSTGRWLVTATTTLPTAGPVPALTPQAGNSNDSASEFQIKLAGFSAPDYGAVG